MFVILAMLGAGGCRRPVNPDIDFERIEGVLRHGDLNRAHQEADHGARSFADRNSEWHWRYTILDASALNLSGKYNAALALLASPLPDSLKNTSLALQKSVLEAQVDAHLQRFEDADRILQRISGESTATTGPISGEFMKALGMVQMEKGEYPQASVSFAHMLQIARQNADTFLESMALLDLGFAALQRERFDEAIDWSNAATAKARAIDAQLIEEVALGNLGWAYYKTGDPERALALFLDAGKRARDLGDVAGEILWLTARGYVYLDEKRFDVAASSYTRALDLARSTDNREDILNTVTSLALTSAQSGEVELGVKYSDEALTLARAGTNRVDELYPQLAMGLIQVHKRDFGRAEQIFQSIVTSGTTDASLKWSAQHGLASIYQQQDQVAKAQAAYISTLVTMESARSSLSHEESRLPFLANASSLYDDYLRFLLSEGKTAEALSVADHSRARTLAEGLGQLRKTESVLPSPLDAQRIARRAGGAILYYWLAEKESYLWAITQQKTTLLRLPPASEIDAAVKRYRKALERPQDVLELQTPDGLELYRILVQPARQTIASSDKIFVIPDGGLNGLNFEALIVPEPKPHFWIDDVTITNASSLRLLERSRPGGRVAGSRLLLVGNPVAPTAEYTTPPQAAAEMAKIGDHFPNSDQQVFAESQATPAAYLASRPGQYSYIHFVAHGTASRLSPLDSAIVLSRSTSAGDSFRLYARDIIQRPLHAELVTISACYGAGTRAYSGEGLVGLSWAFLRAGAHNVIGALWDVSDASTPLLMDRMYAEIRNGKRPEEALRIAKLFLLHSDNAFRRPFYWAPFQFYTGS